MNKLFSFSKYYIVIIITAVLFIIPFFWLKTGEMDLGGDSNRLYFYDPVNNLKEFAIYSITSGGTGKFYYNQYFIPYLLFLSLLKYLFNSPTIVIIIFNGFKLSGSFIFMFLVIKELLNKNIRKMSLGDMSGCMIGSLFYTFSPAVLENMKYALITHDLVFLNPLIFYLILKSVKNSSMKYLWSAIFISLIFSSSFALFNPPFVAFYPLALLFLFLYNRMVLKRKFPWKGVLLGGAIFLGIHAFHIIPVASNIFDSGSEFNNRIFEGKQEINAGLEYFNAILGQGKISRNIFLPLADPHFSGSLIIIPLLTFLGLLFVPKQNRTLILSGMFFLITLFLISANVTTIGVSFYRLLFSIPGFGMFRGFYGQWQWVYVYFYAILTGISISYVFSKISNKLQIGVFILAVGFLTARSWMVFTGDVIDVVRGGSNGTRVIIQLDPNYEEMLSYIKQIPNDGKLLHMPFTDYTYNIVGGKNNGVYIGPSMLSFLVGRNDYPGYQTIDPFSEVFVKLVKEKNYPLIKHMMSLLQIRYVLYNSDEKVSDTYFPAFPYGHNGVPTKQNELSEFVDKISSTEIYKTGSYSLREIDRENYLPHFYPAKKMTVYDTNKIYDHQYESASSFFPEEPSEMNEDIRIAYVNREDCKKLFDEKICEVNTIQKNIDDVQISYQKVNPTKYKLQIKNASEPFLLVFSNEYSLHWKLFADNNAIQYETNSNSYFDGSIIELKPENQFIDRKPFETNSMQLMFDNSHIKVNEYANAWYINSDFYESNGGTLDLIVEMTAQKRFYYSLGISVVTLILFLVYGIKIFWFDK